jgi:hypothetical protein
MINLNPLESDTLDEFELIRIRKNNPILSNLNLLTPRIASRYVEYDNKYKANRLEDIVSHNYSYNEKITLTLCYSSPTKARNYLIKRIKENQPRQIRSIYQFCGINTDSTSDHYFT